MNAILTKVIDFFRAGYNYYMHLCYVAMYLSYSICIKVGHGWWKNL